MDTFEDIWEGTEDLLDAGQNRDLLDSLLALSSFDSGSAAAVGLEFDSDASGNGNFQNGEFCLDFHNSEHLEWASAFTDELSKTEESLISLFSRGLERKRGRNKRSPEAQAIRVDDFDSELEKKIFAYLYGYFSLIFDAKNENDPRIKDAIDFIFSRHQDDSEFPSFEESLSSYDPNARPNLFRLRLMYELWYVGWKMPELPDDSVPLPEYISSRIETQFRQDAYKIFGQGWDLDDALSVAEELWIAPGINQTHLYHRVKSYRENIDEKSFAHVIHFLDKMRMISGQMRRKINLRRYNQNAEDWEDLDEIRFYITGENPRRFALEVSESEGYIPTVSFMQMMRFVY